MELKPAAECVNGQSTVLHVDAAETAPGSSVMYVRAPYFVRIKRSLATVARYLLPGRQYDQLRHAYRRVRTARHAAPVAAAAAPASPVLAAVPVPEPAPVPAPPPPPQIVTTVVQVDSQKERVDRVSERIERLTEQMERLKSRNTTLDGKLNIALYGLPRMDRYVDRLITNPLLASVSSDFDTDEFLLHLRGDDATVQARYSARLENLRTLAGLDEFEPRTLLDLGCGDGLVTECFTSVWPSIESVYGVDNLTGGLRRLQEGNRLQEAGRLSAGMGGKTLAEIKFIQTDMMTAMMALEGRKFDFIACVHAFEHLSPHEQIQFLVLATQSLTPDGVLYVEAPNVLNLTVLRDLFWIDPQHLRPFSMSMLTKALDRFAPGKYDWGVWSESDGSNVSGAEYTQCAAAVDTEYLDLFLCLKNS